MLHKKYTVAFLSFSNAIRKTVAVLSFQKQTVAFQSFAVKYFFVAFESFLIIWVAFQTFAVKKFF